MALVVVENGLLLACVDWATKANAVVYKIGLYKNNYTPSINGAIGSITPCDFGGYVGLQNLPSWVTGGIVFAGDRAITYHPSITWTANGASTNDVYGYYVVDSAGVLRWAERRVQAPIPYIIGTLAGQTYTVEPRMTLGNVP